MSVARLTQALLGVPGAPVAAVLRMRWQRASPLALGLWVGTALLVVGGAGTIAWLLGPRLRGPVLSGGLLALALLVWGDQLGALLEQNHPQAARLVPGHLRVLRRVTVAMWFVLSLACGALAWWMFDGRLSFWGCVLVAALCAATLAWCLRWPLLWLVPGLAPLLWPPLLPGAGLAEQWLALAEAWRAHAPWSTMVPLALLAGSVAAIFGHGDERHARVFARQARWRGYARKDNGGSAVPAASAPPAWLHALAWPFVSLTAAWIAFLLRRARPGRRSVMARAELVLHRQQHWMYHLLGVVGVLLLLGLIVIGLLTALRPVAGGVSLQQVWQHGHFGIAIGVASMGLNVVFMLPRVLWLSRREQALLVLLPGMPRGRALNAAVARQQLRHAAVAWGLTAAFALWLYAVTGTAIGLCLALVALPLGLLWLLKAPATLRQGPGLRETVPVVGTLLGGVLLQLACFGWGKPAAPGPVAALAAGGLALSLALGHWRWRRVVEAPPALPAGRLG